MKNTTYLQNLIDDGILKGGDALDLGCGDGNASVFLADHGYDVYAVDIEPPIAPFGIKQGSITTMKQDIRDTIIPENTYDFINARNILPFLKREEIGLMLDRMWKGLKPRGVMFFTLFGAQDEWNGIKKHMTFLSEDEVTVRTFNFHPYYKNIFIGVGKTMDGKKKMSHIYSFTCVKEL